LAAAGIAAAWYLINDANSSAQEPTTLTRTITAPPPQVAVPGVVGLSHADATAALERAGLREKAVRVPSSRPVGEVVAQHPSAGERADRGSTVRINLSAGEETAATTTAATTNAAPPEPLPATVPSLVGGDVSSAAQKLGGAGLLASVQYVPGNERLGIVRAQSPAPGSSVKHLSHVTVNASSGPSHNPRRTVPNVVGRPLDAAVSAAHAAGLRVIYLELPVTDRTQVGEVVEQTPAPGRTAPQNAEVLVYLGALRS
jgi:serine/threonine-protein kinase